MSSGMSHCVSGCHTVSVDVTLSLDVTLCHWMSRCVTGCHAVSLDVTLCLWMSHCVTGCHTVSLDVTLCLWMSHCVTGCHTVSLDITLCLWMSHCVTGCHTVSLDVTLCHWMSAVWDFFLHCLTLKTEALPSFKTLATTQPLTQHHISRPESSPGSLWEPQILHVTLYKTAILRTVTRTVVSGTGSACPVRHHGHATCTLCWGWAPLSVMWVHVVWYTSADVLEESATSIFILCWCVSATPQAITLTLSAVIFDFVWLLDISNNVWRVFDNWGSLGYKNWMRSHCSVKCSAVIALKFHYFSAPSQA